MFQPYTYFLKLFILLFFVNATFGAEPSEAKTNHSMGMNITTEKPVTIINESLTTTVAVNETVTTETASAKTPGNVDEGKKVTEYKPVVVTPTKTRKPAPAPHKEKIEEIKEIPHQTKSHPERIFLLVVLILVGCCLCFHNKNKILGLIVEGRTARVHGRRATNVRYRRLNTDEASVEAGIQ